MVARALVGLPPMLGFRLVQEGEGSPRALVVIYNLAAGGKNRTIDKAITDAVGPRVAIINQTIAPSGIHHPDYSVTQGKIAPLPDVVAAWRGKLGAELGPVVVAGFSAGGKGVREQLKYDPAGAFVADGTHASDPPDWANQILPWHPILAMATAGARALVLTHTMIEPSGYLGTRETIEHITGQSHRTDRPATTFDVGNARVYSYPGADAAAHVHQATKVFAPKLAETLKLIDPKLCIGGSCGPTPGPGPGSPGQPPPATPAVDDDDTPIANNVERAALIGVGVIAIAGAYLAFTRP